LEGGARSGLDEDLVGNTGVLVFVTTTFANIDVLVRVSCLLLAGVDACTDRLRGREGSRVLLSGKVEWVCGNWRLILFLRRLVCFADDGVGREGAVRVGRCCEGEGG